MTNEELIAALREEDAYNERFYEQDPLHKLSADRIEQLVKYRDAYAECDRIGTQAVRDLEAKLAMAVDALCIANTWMPLVEGYYQGDNSYEPDCRAIRKVLAELEGKK